MASSRVKITVNKSTVAEPLHHNQSIKHESTQYSLTKFQLHTLHYVTSSNLQALYEISAHILCRFIWFVCVCVWWLAASWIFQQRTVGTVGYYFAIHNGKCDVSAGSVQSITKHRNSNLKNGSASIVLGAYNGADMNSALFWVRCWLNKLTKTIRRTKVRHKESITHTTTVYSYTDQCFLSRKVARLLRTSHFRFKLWCFFETHSNTIRIINGPAAVFCVLS